VTKAMRTLALLVLASMMLLCIAMLGADFIDPH
jgi:hypothetical protein